MHMLICLIHDHDTDILLLYGKTEILSVLESYFEVVPAVTGQNGICDKDDHLLIV